MRGRIDRPAWCGQRRGDRHVRDRGGAHDQHRHRDVRSERPAKGGGRDDRDPAGCGDDEGDGARGSRSRIDRRGGAFRVEVAEQQRQQAADQHRHAREITESRLGQQVDRARAEIRGDEERSDQVPGSVKALGPAKRAAQELRPSADAVPEQPDRPHELEGVAALPPLVEDEGGEREAQHAGAQRQRDI